MPPPPPEPSHPLYTGLYSNPTQKDHTHLTVCISPPFTPPSSSSVCCLAVYSFGGPKSYEKPIIFRARAYEFSSSTSNLMNILNLPKSLEDSIRANYKYDLANFTAEASNIPLPEFQLIPNCTVTFNTSPVPKARFSFLPPSMLHPGASRDPSIRSGNATYHGTLPESGVLVTSQFSSLNSTIRVFDEISITGDKVYINDRGENEDGTEVVYGKEVWSGCGPYICERTDIEGATVKEGEIITEDEDTKDATQPGRGLEARNVRGEKVRVKGALDSAAFARLSDYVVECGGTKELVDGWTAGRYKSQTRYYTEE
ncbi:hypothetical protein TrRE_jg11809, partial [Triparma retinervis]